MSWFPVDLRVWSGTVSDNHHSKKGKSVVVLKFHCETERGGGFHSVLTRKQRHLVLVSQFSSIWHINAFTVSSTRGKPMVTLSTCSYKFPANWEKVFFFVFFFFVMLWAYFLLKQLS